MKKISIYIFCGMLSTALFSCNGTKTTKTEYSIDEIGKLYNETEELFKEEAKYLTDDELSGDVGYELYKKCSKKTGLPFNKQITIRGKKHSSIIGFCISSDDNKYSIVCTGSENEKNKSLFVDNGENVIVNGIMSKEDSAYGSLSDSTFISPKKIDESYNNNISELLDDYDNLEFPVTVQGEIDLVQSLDEFENTMRLMENANYNFDFSHSNTAVTLKSDTEEGGSITFTCTAEELGDFKRGDHIAVQGFIDDLMSSQHFDGTEDVFWGMMDDIYEIYDLN